MKPDRVAAPPTLPAELDRRSLAPGFLPAGLEITRAASAASSMTCTLGRSNRGPDFSEATIRAEA
jgi:hypothetical protein